MSVLPNIGDDCIQHIFKYFTNKELIIQSIKTKNIYLTTLLLNRNTRKYFFEYCEVYNNEYVIKKLGVPLDYDELKFQLIGKIRNNDFEFIDSFPDYRTTLLDDLLSFCAENDYSSEFMTLVLKMNDIYPIYFKEKLEKYLELSSTNEHSIIYEYIKYKFHSVLDSL